MTGSFGASRRAWWKSASACSHSQPPVDLASHVPHPWHVIGEFERSQDFLGFLSQPERGISAGLDEADDRFLNRKGIPEHVVHLTSHSTNSTQIWK